MSLALPQSLGRRLWSLYPTSLSRSISKRDASSSSERWQSRQGKDKFALQAKIQGLRSRAAFKLLEVQYMDHRCHGGSAEHVDFLQINKKYKILKQGQTVVDLVSSVATFCVHMLTISGIRAGFLGAGKAFPCYGAISRI